MIFADGEGDVGNLTEVTWEDRAVAAVGGRKGGLRAGQVELEEGIKIADPFIVVGGLSGLGILAALDLAKNLRRRSGVWILELGDLRPLNHERENLVALRLWVLRAVEIVCEVPPKRPPLASDVAEFLLVDLVILLQLEAR